MDLDIQIRELREGDLAVADRIFRLAFGTRLGLPDPKSFGGDSDWIRARWLADPGAAFAAEVGGELIASIFAARWGSMGILGPLSVHPKYWDHHVGRKLMERAVALLDEWGVAQAGVFTASHSPRHIALCQKFDFWPRFLTAIMSLAIQPPKLSPAYVRLSDLPTQGRETCLRACAGLTHEILEGLDLGREVRAVAEQHLGETVLLGNASEPTAFAVCHIGPGTEAGSTTCYVKFAAARPGDGAENYFHQLLDAILFHASSKGATRLVAGMNTARHEAYQAMLQRGFHTDVTGIAMHRPNQPFYNCPGSFVIDDWR
jgi:GNAT superfamily N-acetyltransferase